MGKCRCLIWLHGREGADNLPGLVNEMSVEFSRSCPVTAAASTTASKQSYATLPARSAHPSDPARVIAEQSYNLYQKEKDIESLKANIAIYHSQLGGLQQKLATEKSHFHRELESQDRASRQRYQGELESLQSRLVEANKKTANLKDEKEALQQESAQTKADLSDATHQIKLLKGIHDDLKEQLTLAEDKLAKEKEQQNQRKFPLQRGLSEGASIVKLKTDKREMEIKQQLESALNEVSSLKQQLARKRRLSLLEDTPITNLSQTTELRQDLAAEKAMRDDCQQHVVELERELGKERTQRESCLSQIVQLRQDLAADRARKEAVQEESFQLQQQIVLLQQELDRVEEDYQHQQKKLLTQHEEELDREKTGSEGLQLQLTQLREQNEKTKDEDLKQRDQVQQELNKERTNCKNLRQQLTQLRELVDKEESTCDLEELQVERERYDRILSSNQQELSETKKTLSTMQTTAEEMMDDLVEAVEAFSSPYEPRGQERSLALSASLNGASKALKVAREANEKVQMAKVVLQRKVMSAQSNLSQVTQQTVVLKQLIQSHRSTDLVVIGFSDSDDEDQKPESGSVQSSQAERRSHETETNTSDILAAFEAELEQAMADLSIVSREVESQLEDANNALEQALTSASNRLAESEKNIEEEMHKLETKSRSDESSTEMLKEKATKLKEKLKKHKSTMQETREPGRNPTPGEPQDPAGNLPPSQATCSPPAQLENAHEIDLKHIVSASEVKLNMERLLGGGAWGYVVEGSFRGKAVAVKGIHANIISEFSIRQFHREIRIMADLRHPNLVLFIAAIVDAKSPMFITELLNKTLRAALEENVLKQGKLAVLRDVACALNYLHLHETPVIHRDVSSSNVLLEEMPNNTWKGKLSDFGSANLVRLATTPGEGAYVYAAPEMRNVDNLQQKNPAVDVFSFGVVLCETVMNKFPYPEEVLQSTLESMQQQWPDIHTIVVQCTQDVPRDRPPIGNVITGLDKLVAAGKVSGL